MVATSSSVLARPPRTGASACMLAPCRKTALPLRRMRVPSTRMSRNPMSSVILSSTVARVHLVKLGRFGRPEGQLAGLDAEKGIAVGVGRTSGFSACLGDVHGDRGAGGRVENVDIAGDLSVARLPGLAVSQMDIVVVNESGGHADEGDIAGKAAVVEPIDTDRGDAINKASGRLLVRSYQRRFNHQILVLFIPHQVVKDPLPHAGLTG
jgi:hypothetical protein